MVLSSSSSDALRCSPLEELVRHVIATLLECGAMEVRASDDLERDLGLTALDLRLIGLSLENLLDEAIPMEVLERVRIVADLSCFLSESRRRYRGPRIGFTSSAGPVAGSP